MPSAAVAASAAAAVAVRVAARLAHCCVSGPLEIYNETHNKKKRKSHEHKGQKAANIATNTARGLWILA